MDYEVLFPGRFLKAADLKGQDVTVAIKSIAAEEIDGKEKAVISFEGAKKQMVCNRTNAESIKLMFGRETNNWIGKRITLYPLTMKDPFSDGDTIALRVRGSPDISQPMSAEVKRGRKTIKVSVKPTGQRAAPPKGNGGGGNGVKPPATTPPPATNGEPSEEEKQAIYAAEQAQAEQEKPF